MHETATWWSVKVRNGAGCVPTRPLPLPAKGSGIIYPNLSVHVAVPIGPPPSQRALGQVVPVRVHYVPPPLDLGLALALEADCLVAHTWEPRSIYIAVLS